MRYQEYNNTVLAGGFGQAKILYDTFLGRKVLYKSMSNANDNDQLYNEIIALSRARSRHVVEIYDVIYDQNSKINGIIIEYLEGRDFDSFFVEFHQSSQEFLSILYQIAYGLNDLHSSGIIHRDLKLENVKASSSGVVKIFDFGLSATTEDYITKNNRGTLVYAAPELYQENARITKEMDIYAFGVIAWSLVLPRNKFCPALLDKPPHSKNNYVSISTVTGNIIPLEINELIDSCLNPTLMMRPSAENIVSILEKYLVANKHRGLFVEGTKGIYELSAKHKGVKLKIGSLGEIEVQYDGLNFIITYVLGDVYVNNIDAVAGTILPKSCLITFGEINLGPRRRFVTFSSSHPEVVL